MKNKKIFLTGGTGFFGKSILSMLLRGFRQEYLFTILSRNPEKFLQNNPQFAKLDNVRFVAGDIKDFAFPNEKFDLIIHAATPAVTTLQPGEMSSVILDGMKRVLAFARQCGAEKMLFTSSGAVYGPQPPDVTNLSEEYLCRPVTEYGIAKLEAEKMLKDSGLHAGIARCFAFVGPYLNRDIHFAIGNFIGDCLAGRDIVIKGDGTPYRSYLYADDLVEWMFAILERGENGRPYNVGSPEGISIAELAKTVSACFGNRSAVKVLGVPRDGVPAARYVPDVTRAKTELGLNVTVALQDAIKKSAE